MKVNRVLHSVANGASSIYRIVFTCILLYEVMRFRWRRNAENSFEHRRGSPR